MKIILKIIRWLGNFISNFWVFFNNF